MAKKAGVFSVLVAGLGIAGAIYFEPWTLFTSSTIDEAIPETSSSIQVEKEESEASETQPGPINPEPEVSYPLTLSEGTFISHEHETSGQVKILELEDGSRVLRIEDLETSDGPQLEVWITDAPVIEGIDGWFVFDDGEYVNLGELKATKGNQNYELPAELNLNQFSSVSIWCSRFAVSFGAAELGT